MVKEGAMTISEVHIANDVSARPQSMSPAEARAIAKHAYTYGFPLVDNYRIQYSYFVGRGSPDYKGQWNQVHNEARVHTAGDKAIQMPNSDTLYSQLGADLRTEPLVITVPTVANGRYYSLQFIDLYTFNFAYVGSRATGNGPGNFLLAGPCWRGERPPRIKEVIRSETDFAFVLYRTQLFGPADIENVEQVQAGYTVQSLSQFQGTRSPAPARAINFIKPPTPNQARTPLDFFKILNFVLQFCPLHASERELLARFAQLGIGPKQTFDADALSPEMRVAVEAGMANAWQSYRQVEKQLASGELTSADLFGTRGYMKNNYLFRMAGAVDGIYGNSREEALYSSYLLDVRGERLNAARQRYVLHFAPYQFPPANSFWSLTMYDLPNRMLVANPLNRYLINSCMLPQLSRDSDGGLTLYVQRDSPGHTLESNWLPAPEGPFLIALRLYWPKPQALSGEWQKPLLQQMHRSRRL
jgi:hypothetical protein